MVGNGPNGRKAERQGGGPAARRRLLVDAAMWPLWALWAAALIVGSVASLPLRRWQFRTGRKLLGQGPCVLAGAILLSAAVAIAVLAIGR